MQDSVANLVKETQGELMQELKELHQDFQEEGMYIGATLHIIS
jgi:hypothetical protein